MKGDGRQYLLLIYSLLFTASKSDLKHLRQQKRGTDTEGGKHCEGEYTL